MYAGDEINYTGAFLFLDIPLPICYPFLQIKKIVQYFKRNDEESSLPEILQRIPGGVQRTGAVSRYISRPGTEAVSWC